MEDKANAAPGGEETLAPSESDVWGEERTARTGPARDEKGRFAKPQADDEAESEGAEAAAPAQAQPETADPAQAATAQPERQPAAQAAQQQPDIDAIVAAALEKAGVKPAAAQQQQQAAPQDPEPDFDADPAAWRAWKQRDDARRDWQTRALLSQEFMRGQHADYDEVEKLVLDAAEKDPSLWAKIHSAAMPARAVYELGKSLKLQQEIGGDPDGWAEKRILDRMRSDEAFRAKVLAEIQPQPAATAKPHLPPALTTARSTAGRSQPAPAAPTEGEVWGGRLSRAH